MKRVGEKGNIYRDVVEGPEERGPFRRPNRIWKCSIKAYLKEQRGGT